MLKAFFSLLFPEFCMACSQSLEEGEQVMCTHCRFELPKTNFHNTLNNELAQRFWGKINISHALAYYYFIKHSKVQTLIHNLKYKEHQEIGALIGRWYGYELAESGLNKKFDLIIPIPLHKSRMKKRGYNQCHTFSKSLSDTMSIPWSSNCVQRVTSTGTQTNKTRFLRWKNVEEIFVVTDKEKIAGKRILLIDDVVTTGATLESCGNVLLKEGAKEIGVACIAMAK